MKTAYYFVPLAFGIPFLVLAQHDEKDFAKAIKAIEKIGGRIAYDDDVSGKPIVAVNMFYCKNVKDEDLANLKFFPMLRGLFLIETPITSKGLLQLEGFGHLEQLDLIDTKIDDEALKWVVKNKQLRGLCLNGTNVTNKGLTDISGLKKLESLSLCGTKVNDAGLGHLGRIKTLRWLHLDQTAVTDKGITSLKKASPKLIIFR